MLLIQDKSKQSGTINTEPLRILHLFWKDFNQLK